MTLTKQKEVAIKTNGRGLYLITKNIVTGLDLPQTGILHCFIQHTSASLLIQENADPTAKEDMETFLNRLIPDEAPWYRHTAEGPDDSTSHLKALLTPTFLLIPIVNHELGLGPWQGIYLWEHRLAPHTRKVIVTCIAGT